MGGELGMNDDNPRLESVNREVQACRLTLQDVFENISLDMRSLEKTVAQSQEKTDASILELKKCVLRLEENMHSTDQRVFRIEQHMHSMDQRIFKIEEHMHNMDQRMELKFDQMDEKFQKIFDLFQNRTNAL